MDGRTGHQPQRYQPQFYQPNYRRQVSDFMSAQRMTLEPRTPSGLDRAGRLLRLAAGLIALAAPLGGCATGALRDKSMAKGDASVEEPADNLSNEGLAILSERKHPKAVTKKSREVARQHPYSDYARKSLLMSAYAFYNA